MLRQAASRKPTTAFIQDLSEDELLELEGLCVAIEVNEGSLTQALLDAVLACATWARPGPGSILRRLATARDQQDSGAVSAQD